MFRKISQNRIPQKQNIAILYEWLGKVLFFREKNQAQEKQKSLQKLRKSSANGQTLNSSNI